VSWILCAGVRDPEFAFEIEGRYTKRTKNPKSPLKMGVMLGELRVSLESLVILN
jgi:hypothetical protein